ncbi:MAG TPA: hypothetical protein VI548_10665 [Chitinophagaceae bacterium]|nr:hypothetical protein [Chitinophagaceae bacterium]
MNKTKFQIPITYAFLLKIIVTKLASLSNFGTMQGSFLIKEMLHERVYSINIHNNKGKK